MFSFHTHEVLSSIHKVESDFWEEMLDKIYNKVVQKHKSCLGLISNTIKTKPNDKIGEFSENTIPKFYVNWLGTTCQHRIRRFPT